MNVVDKVQLDLFLAEMRRTRIPAKDRQADDAIRCALELRPDALYLLVQRTLQLQSALGDAQAKIARLERGDASSPRSVDEAIQRDDDPWWRDAHAGSTSGAILLQSAKSFFRYSDEVDAVDAAMLPVDIGADKALGKLADLLYARRVGTEHADSPSA
jgi:hypothetical protein